MPKIIIVEPHPLLRLGLVQLLSDIVPDSEVTGADYNEMTRSDGAGIETDLVLLAVTDLECIYERAAQTMTAYAPKAMLLMSDDDDMPELPRGLPARVKGYISRHAAPQVLQASVRLVLAGGTCYPRFTPPSSNGPSPQGHTAEQRNGSGAVHTASSSNALFAATPAQDNNSNETLGSRRIVAKAMSDAASSLAAQAIPRGPHQEWEMLGLTPRQYEVLILLARGHSMKMVGRQLNISAATAKAHAEALYQRLDVHNRNAAVYAAVSRGATLGWSSISAAGRELKAWAET